MNKCTTKSVPNQDPVVEYCPAAGEFYWQAPDGGFIWAEDKQTCERLAADELRVMRDHARRCPDDIPFDGRPVQRQEDGSPADYGLEVW